MHGTKNSQATQNEKPTTHNRGGKGQRCRACRAFIVWGEKTLTNTTFIVRKKGGAGVEGFKS